MADAPPWSRHPAAAELEPTAAERRVLDAAARGVPAAFDPEAPEAERTLRAEVLTALLLGLRDDWPVDPRGLRVSGAVVAGGFDLSYAKSRETGDPATPSFRFTECAFEELVDLTAAHLDHIVFARCTLPGGCGRSLRCAGVVLVESRIDGGVDLGEASIDGPMDATCATGATRLDLDDACVGGGVFFKAPMVSPGDGKSVELNLTDARVAGNVHAMERTFHQIAAPRCRVESDLHLDAVAARSVDITGAVIGGRLRMRGARLRHEGGIALEAESVRVRGAVCLADDDVPLDEPFSSIGTVRFPLAHLGSLDAAGAQFDRGESAADDGDVALQLQFAEIDGPLRFRATRTRPFMGRGRLDLTGAQIAGELDLRGGMFLSGDHIGAAVDQKALCLDRAELRSAVRFGRRGGFTSVVVGAASFDGCAPRRGLGAERRRLSRRRR